MITQVEIILTIAVTQLLLYICMMKGVMAVNTYSYRYKVNVPFECTHSLGRFDRRLEEYLLVHLVDCQDRLLERDEHAPPIALLHSRWLV